MPKIQNKGEDYASKKIHSDPAAHRLCNRVVPGGVIFLFKKAESRLAQLAPDGLKTSLWDLTFLQYMV